MGEGSVALSALTLDKLTEEVITLKEDNNTEEYLGQIVLGLRLVPKSQFEGDNSSAVGSLVKAALTTSATPHVAASTSSKDIAGNEGLKMLGGKRLQWSATVNIVLVEGRDLQAMDPEGTSDPYCKVRWVNFPISILPLLSLPWSMNM